MTFALLLILVVADGPAQTVELSRHATRATCALAAHNERSKPWSEHATVRIYACRAVEGRS